jgi:hypothetical protein
MQITVKEYGNFCQIHYIQSPASPHPICGEPPTYFLVLVISVIYIKLVKKVKISLLQAVEAHRVARG